VFFFSVGIKSNCFSSVFFFSSFVIYIKTVASYIFVGDVACSKLYWRLNVCLQLVRILYEMAVPFE